jgi:hypothetical protein
MDFFVVQDDGTELPVFAYVWGEEYHDTLSNESWSFEHFMKNDFKRFWKEELEGELGVPLSS